MKLRHLWRPFRPAVAMPAAISPARADLACKWFGFPGGCGAFLVLPVSSEDPVVTAYLERRPLNDYMLQILAQTSAAGDQVIDLGCHVGTFSIGAAAMGRRVFSVDASPLHVALVGHSRDINRFETLQLQRAAISQKVGTIRFIENGLFGAIDFAGTTAGTVETATRGLDDIVAENRLGPVRFLKMDIEGAEVDAILTGRNLLARDQPLIWYESNGPTLRQAGRSIDELRRLLESLGYRNYRLVGDRWVYAPPGQIQPEAWLDMLAIGPADQQKYAARIDATWAAADLLETCRHWAGLTYPSTRLHLLEEIRSHTVDPAIAGDIGSIRHALEAVIEAS